MSDFGDTRAVDFVRGPAVTVSRKSDVITSGKCVIFVTIWPLWSRAFPQTDRRSALRVAFISSPVSPKKAPCCQIERNSRNFMEVDLSKEDKFFFLYNKVCLNRMTKIHRCNKSSSHASEYELIKNMMK